MKTSLFITLTLFSVTLGSLLGCGKSEPAAVKGNEIGDYLSEHPELVEAAAEADKALNESGN